MLTENERLALEQLEAERERRIDEKVEKGEAIRVPLHVVVGTEDAVVAATESARARKLAELGDKQQVFFEETVLITGVRRMGRDIPDEPRVPSTPSKASQPERVDVRRGGEALRLPERDETHQPRPTPQPMPEPRYVYAEIQPASEGDPGAIIEGRYAASDGMVRVWDMQGKLLGTQAFNGDNPGHVARKVLRAKRNTGFYDPLPYPRTPIV